MAIGALVCGIVALVFSVFFGWLPIPIGVLVGIVGAVLGALGRKNDPAKQGMATGGLVMSIIAIALGLIFWIVCYGCIACAGAGALNELANYGYYY